MDRIKLINWKGVVYWFVVMAIMNVYIIPKFINHQVITTSRIIVGILVSIVVAILMGLLTIPKTKNTQK